MLYFLLPFKTECLIKLGTLHGYKYQQQVCDHYVYPKFFTSNIIFEIQAFIDFRSFEFRNFWFTVVYNSILFSFPLVLLSSLDLRGIHFPRFVYVSPH